MSWYTSNMFGSFIRKIRRDREMSQEALAIAADVTRQTIMQLESHGSCNIKTAFKLCKALGVEHIPVE